MRRTRVGLGGGAGLSSPGPALVGNWIVLDGFRFGWVWIGLGLIRCGLVLAIDWFGSRSVLFGFRSASIWSWVLFCLGLVWVWFGVSFFALELLCVMCRVFSRNRTNSGRGTPIMCFSDSVRNLLHNASVRS